MFRPPYAGGHNGRVLDIYHEQSDIHDSDDWYGIQYPGTTGSVSHADEHPGSSDVTSFPNFHEIFSTGQIQGTWTDTVQQYNEDLTLQEDLENILAPKSQEEIAELEEYLNPPLESLPVDDHLQETDELYGLEQIDEAYLKSLSSPFFSPGHDFEISPKIIQDSENFISLKSIRELDREDYSQSPRPTTCEEGSKYFDLTSFLCDHPADAPVNDQPNNSRDGVSSPYSKNENKVGNSSPTHVDDFGSELIHGNKRIRLSGNIPTESYHYSEELPLSSQRQNFSRHLITASQKHVHSSSDYQADLIGSTSINTNVDPENSPTHATNLRLLSSESTPEILPKYPGLPVAGITLPTSYPTPHSILGPLFTDGADCVNMKTMTNTFYVCLTDSWSTLNVSVNSSSSIISTGICQFRKISSSGKLQRSEYSFPCSMKPGRTVPLSITLSRSGSIILSSGSSNARLDMKGWLPEIDPYITTSSHKEKALCGAIPLLSGSVGFVALKGGMPDNSSDMSLSDILVLLPLPEETSTDQFDVLIINPDTRLLFRGISDSTSSSGYSVVVDESKKRLTVTSPEGKTRVIELVICKQLVPFFHEYKMRDAIKVIYSSIIRTVMIRDMVIPSPINKGYQQTGEVGFRDGNKNICDEPLVSDG